MGQRLHSSNAGHLVIAEFPEIVNRAIAPRPSPTQIAPTMAAAVPRGNLGDAWPLLIAGCGRCFSRGTVGHAR